MGKFVRGTLDKRVFSRLMMHKKDLIAAGFSPSELTLPALQRFDDSLVAVRVRKAALMIDKRRILKILRGL